MVRHRARFGRRRVCRGLVGPDDAGPPRLISKGRQGTGRSASETAWTAFPARRRERGFGLGSIAGKPRQSSLIGGRPLDFAGWGLLTLSAAAQAGFPDPMTSPSFSQVLRFRTRRHRP